MVQYNENLKEDKTQELDSTHNPFYCKSCGKKLDIFGKITMQFCDDACRKRYDRAWVRVRASRDKYGFGKSLVERTTLTQSAQ